MPDQKKHILKGAEFAEEGKGGDGHAAAILLPLEGQNGFVFGVTNALGTKDSFDVFAGIVQNHLERLSTTIESGTNLTHRFEQLLQALNEDIGRAAEEGQFSLPMSESSGVIGIAGNDTVVVSGFGNLLAQFMHKSDKERYDIYDLARGMRVEEEIPTWKKPFLTVLDGELKTDDVLFIGTRVSRHDLSGSTLNEIVTTLPPNSAVSKIRQYLPIETVFAAVILKADPFAAPTLISEGTARSSMEKFDHTKSTTDRLLSEQKPEIRSMAMKLWLVLFPKRGSEDRRKMIKHLFRFLSRLVIVFVTVAGQILIGLTTSAFTLAKRAIRNPKQIIAAIHRGREKLDQHIRAGIHKFNRLPKMSKYILLSFITIGFVLVASIVFINKQQAQAMDQKAYSTAVDAVQKKIDNAAASLIYGDENQARTLLNDASQLANALPVTPDARKQKAEDLKNQITQKRDQLRHLVAVDVKQVTDASGLAGESMAAVSNLAGKWYGITDKGNIYGFDPATEALVKTDVTKGDVGTPTATTTGDNAIYWLDAAGLSRFIPSTGEVAPLSVNRKGVDLQYYGGKMYILSPESGQVYKHQRTATGFDGGSAWIISGVSSVANGAAITIDGYIWILKSDGSILRYMAGKETDWKVGPVEPALLNTTDIWTNDASKYLYIMDPNEKRIVVFDKDKGTLVTQYTNDAFTGMKSMVVDEANKKITVLAGNKVYQFDTK